MEIRKKNHLLEAEGKFVLEIKQQY